MVFFEITLLVIIIRFARFLEVFHNYIIFRFARAFLAIFYNYIIIIKFARFLCRFL